MANGTRDYLIQVKANAPDLAATLTHCLQRRGAQVFRAQTSNRGHGRYEERHLEMVATSPSETGWPHTFTACRLVRRRQQWRRGQILSDSTSTALYVASFPVTTHTPEKVQALIRGHWSIENGLHHRKDRSLDEDRNRAAATGSGRVCCALRSLTALIFGRAKLSLGVLQHRFTNKPAKLLKLLFAPSLSFWERTYRSYPLRSV